MIPRSEPGKRIDFRCDEPNAAKIFFPCSIMAGMARRRAVAARARTAGGAYSFFSSEKMAVLASPV